MPAQYDIKSIGDQVHRLTLALEIEKMVTNLALTYIKGTSGVRLDPFYKDVRAGVPPAKDADGELFFKLVEERYAEIRKMLGD